MTDNKARAAAHVKAVVSKFGGSLSKVLYQFVRKGVIVMKLEGKRLDDVFEQVLEVGVEDAEEEEDNQIKVPKLQINY
jgi:transcriptional/translational regulatory protein YebC/TACO1